MHSRHEFAYGVARLAVVLLIQTHVLHELVQRADLVAEAVLVGLAPPWIWTVMSWIAAAMSSGSRCSGIG